jgi:phosphopantetheine--protein transferase-like protein
LPANPAASIRLAPRSVPVVGVDLVEIEKARAFYSRHKKRLTSFFSAAEIRFIRRGKIVERLAILLAAKEAAFKAVPGRIWMGPEGFRSIRLSPERGKKLSFRIPGTSARLALEATTHPHYVTVTCAGIS